MSSSIESLSACTTPGATARVFNPTRPEYYLKDEVAAAAQKPPEPTAAVQVTLSQEAQAALKG